MARDRQPFIGIFGRRNSGKSTLINRLAGQEIAIVSDVPGTTTDPVKKSFEITGFGPVVFVDTAGIDDIGELGKKRVSKTLQAIHLIDLAILVVTHNHFGEKEQQLIQIFNNRELPFIVVHNKCDLTPPLPATGDIYRNSGSLAFLELSPSFSIDPLINAIRLAIPESAFTNPSLLGDLIQPGDLVLLITPIDSEAPEGRLILPQVQTIRDILDNNAVSIVLKENQVESFLQRTCMRPVLAITDSQVFKKANEVVPADIPLTSFSILLARFKGDFSKYMEGTPVISRLQDGDRILLLESCSHHVACDDIGRVKIPTWMKAHQGKKLIFDVVAGLDQVERPITDYALVVQCGGCMITRRQLHNRLTPAIEADVPVTNYGMAIAWMHDIYQRAVEPFVGKE